MYPINDIPIDLPGISMKNLTEDQLEDLRDISLANAIKEARRRIKEADIQRHNAFAARIRAHIASMTTYANGTGVSLHVVPAMYRSIQCSIWALGSPFAAADARTHPVASRYGYVADNLCGHMAARFISS